jgi:hypothetical protein
MTNALTEGADIAVYLAFMYTALIVVCISIVVYYAEPGFPWHTYLTNIVGYFCSFGVLLLVPIDIAVVIVDRRSTFPENDPTYNNHVKILSAAYSTFFTIILIFGSFVLVFEEYYNTDGNKNCSLTETAFIRQLMLCQLFLSRQMLRVYYLCSSLLEAYSTVVVL